MELKSSGMFNMSCDWTRKMITPCGKMSWPYRLTLNRRWTALTSDMAIQETIIRKMLSTWCLTANKI
eukprot:30999-Ditylum_brightwellii.AAC.1